MRSSTESPRHANCILQNFRYTKVSNLNNVSISQEDVLRFYISMHRPSIMAMLHSQTNLSEHVEDCILCKIFRFFTVRIVLFLLNDISQVPIARVLHYNIELLTFGFVDFSKSNYVRMVQSFEDFCFFNSLSEHFFCHISYINLLNDNFLPSRLTLSQDSFPE